MNSFNHYANGSIGDWLYRKVAGINQLEAGYRKFYVKPMFVRGIEEARGTLETPYGKIISAWSCKNKKITVDITVPENTTAIIYLPEKEDLVEVGSGVYHYEYATETVLKELKYSFDSTLGEIMDHPVGLKMLNEMVPELMANQMIEYAKRMTLAEGVGAAPDIRVVFEMVVKALNELE